MIELIVSWSLNHLEIASRVLVSIPSTSSGNIAEWGGGGAGRKEYMSHKQGKGLQDAIFWTCNRNLPTTAYDCTGSVKKEMGPSTARHGWRRRSGSPIPYCWPTTAYCQIQGTGNMAFSCIYTDAPQTPTPAPMDSSNAGLIQMALVRLHRYQNKTKGHESGTVTNRVRWGWKGWRRIRKEWEVSNQNALCMY